MPVKPKDVLKTYFETGDIPTQEQFEDLIDSMMTQGYAFIDEATPDTIPITPENKVFYIATTSGVYEGFGGIVVNEGEMAILKWNGSAWSKGYLHSCINGLRIEMGNVGYVKTDGTILADSTFSHSDFIPVLGGEKVFVTGYAGNNTVGVITAYDEHKNFLSCLLAGASLVDERAYYGVSVDVPGNASFIRVSLANNTNNRYISVFAGISSEYKSISSPIKSATREIARGKRIIGEELVLSTTDDLFTDPNSGFSAFQGASVNYDNAGYFSVDCSASTSRFPGIRNNLLGAQIHNAGKKIAISFFARKFSNVPTNPFGLYVSYDIIKSVELTTDWRRYTIVLSASEVSQMDRVQFSFDNPPKTPVANLGFDIRDISIIFPETIAGDVVDNTTAIDVINARLNAIAPALAGKKIAIIGDSISTINGKNTPYWIVKSVDVGNEIESYVTWWDVWANSEGTTPTNKTIGGVSLTAAMIGTKQTFTPVAGDVGKAVGVSQNYNSAGTKVWSEKFCEETGAVLLANASWSGARICSGQGGTWELSEAWSDFTIGCCKTRDDEGNDVTPDIIIIYRGTNDFSHSPISRVDEVSLADGVPATDYINGVYEFKAGYYKTIQKLRAAYPNAYIVCCTLNVFKRVTYDVFPTRNEHYTLPEMNDAIREIANTMGCGIIEFDKDGITFENCYSGGYITDSATIPTHPNSKGHAVMAQRAIVDMRYFLQE